VTATARQRRHPAAAAPETRIGILFVMIEVDTSAGT
jgi:hypothetical protein